MALVTAVVQVQSQELPHAMDVTKKKKKDMEGYVANRVVIFGEESIFFFFGKI